MPIPNTNTSGATLKDRTISGATPDVPTGGGDKAAATGDLSTSTSGSTPTGSAGGDLTGTYPNPTLTTSGVTATTYGSSTQVPVLTVDAKGRITSATTATIGSASSDLGWINVKDYGAVGDGATNDSTAIAAAIAAMVDGSVLYFPPGDYRTGTLDINGPLDGIRILGCGPGVSIVKSNASFDAGDGAGVTPGSQVLNIDEDCTRVEVSGFTLDGSCTHRKAGQQAVVIDADYCHFHHCETINSGEYANTFGRNRTTPLMVGLHVNDCSVRDCFADGINLYRISGAVVSDCIVNGADDDLIAIGECENVRVSNCVLSANTSLGTAWGRGVAILPGCDNIAVSDVTIDTVKQHGVMISSEGGTRPTNITFSNVTITNCATSSGYGVEVVQSDGVTLQDVVIRDIAGGLGYYLADVNDLVIDGGLIRQDVASFFRGIACDGSAASWATTWSNWLIRDVTIQILDSGSNEAIYLVPDSTITIDDLIISGIVSNHAPSGNYIYTNYLGGTAKIVNNTCLQGRSIADGGGGVTPTTANNN